MYRLVLLRHGESEWNKENRFTGWTDVRFIGKRNQRSHTSRKNHERKRFCFSIRLYFLFKRAIKTLVYAMEEMDQLWIPVEKTWRLNEKHYGFLQGLNKKETVDKYGEEESIVVA
jgi:2,3-bisphosphoglycerate-dependent phosphoglycerate mutase